MPFGAAKLNTISKQRGRPWYMTTANGATISTSRSKFGSGSAFFDGIDDRMNLTQDLRNSPEFTWECWFYPLGSGVLIYFSGGNAVFPNGNPHLTQTGPGGGLRLSMDGESSSNVLTHQNVIPRNTWSHAALCRNSSNVMRLYLNGVQSGSSYTRSQTFGNGNSIALGNRPSNDLSYDYRGYIDEVRISKVCRYTASFTPDTEPFTNDDNTLLLLHFNDYNGSTEIVDDVGQTITETRPALTATVAGNSQISTAQSKVGSSSALFDGSGDYIRFTSDTLRLKTEDFTIECWIRPNSLAAGVNKMLYDQRSADTQVNIVIFLNSTNALNFWVNGAARIQTGNNFLTTDTWYHIAVVRFNGLTRMFVDGTEVGSAYVDSNNYLGAPVVIGSGWDGTQGPFNTYIDELRVSNTDRYGKYTIPTSAFSLDSDTSLLMHFDGADNSTTFTEENGLTVTRVGDSKISTTQSVFNGASGLFDGTGDYVSLADNNDWDLATTDWTIEFWVYPINGFGMTNANTGSNQGWRLYMDSGNVINFTERGASANQRLSLTCIQLNAWQHVAVERKGTLMSFYHNGRLVGRYSGASTIVNSTASLLIGGIYGVGASAWTTTFNAVNFYMDELRISRVARYYSTTTSFTPSTEAFTPDNTTLLLLHMEGANASTTFTDSVS
jgi:hypothetical protein